MGLVAEFPVRASTNEPEEEAAPEPPRDPMEHLKDDTHLASDRLPPSEVGYDTTKKVITLTQSD